MKPNRLFAAATAAALLFSLTACGANPAAPLPGADAADPATAATGRWVEEEIPLQGREPVGQPTLLADGTLRMYVQGAEDTYALTIADDGATWEETPTGWAQAAPGAVIHAYTGPDGSAVFQTRQETETGKAPRAVYLQAPGGTPRALPLGELMGSAETLSSTDGSAGSALNLTSAAFLPSGSVLLLLTGYQTDGSGQFTQVGHLLTYDPAADTLTPCPVDAPEQLLTLLPCGDAVYYLAWGGESGCDLYRLDPASGKSEPVLSPMPGGDSHPLAADADGNLYWAATDGIYRLAAAGTLPEQILDGTALALNVTGNTAWGICRTPGGSFLVLLADDQMATRLYRYRYDETLPAHAETTLEVWALQDNPTLRTALNAYRTAHPAVDVRLTLALAEGDSETARRDALTALNTELLAGQGPDVLILDGVDYQSYAAQGLLLDLSGTVALGELQQNIITPFVQADGAAPVLPARFSVPVLAGDAGTLAGLTDLPALLAKIQALPPRPDLTDSEYTQEPNGGALPEGERYAVSFHSAAELTDFVLNSGAAALVQGNTLDEAALTEAMTFLDGVARHYNLAAYRPAEETVLGGVTYGADGVDWVTLPETGLEYNAARAQYGWATLQSPELYNVLARHQNPQEIDSPLVPHELALCPGLTPGAYTPLVLTAVNANTPYPEAALALAAALFGGEVQGSYNMDGLPVRAESLQESIARAARMNTDRADADAQAALTALLESCTTPVTVPQPLRTSFLAHAQALVTGAEDLHAAVAGVQQDLQLYLAEQG